MLAAPRPLCPVDAKRLTHFVARPIAGRVAGLPHSAIALRHTRLAAVLMCQVESALLLDHGGHQAVSIPLVSLHRPRAPACTCPDRSAHWPSRSDLIHA